MERINKVITALERLRAFGVLGAYASSITILEVEGEQRTLEGQLEFSTEDIIFWHATLEVRKRVWRVRDMVVQGEQLFAVPPWRWELRLRLFVDDEIYDDPDVTVSRIVDVGGVKEVYGRVLYENPRLGLRDTAWTATGRPAGRGFQWAVRSGAADPAVFDQIRRKLDRHVAEEAT